MRRIWHSPWVIVGFIAACAVFAASCIANAIAGWHFTSNPQLKPVFAGFSVATDFVKAIALFAVAGAWNRKKYAASFAAFLIFLVCAVWALRSAADFMSSSLSEVMVERSNTGASTASLKAELKILVEGQAGLLAMAANDDLRRADRDSAAKRYDANAKRINDLRPQVARAGAVDELHPLAATLSITNRDLTTYTAAYFAFMMEVIATLGFWSFARASDPPPKVQRERRWAVLETIGFSVNKPKYPKISALSEPVTNRYDLPNQERAQLGKAEPVYAPKVPVAAPARQEQKSSPGHKSNIISFKDRLMRAKNPTDEVFDKPNLPKVPEVTKANVHRFIREMLESEEGTHTASITIFEAYVEWCKINNIYKPIGHNWLGMFLGQHWDRFNVDRKPWYANVALRPPMIVVEPNQGGESTGT
jgi:hypothetical protein